MIDEIHEYSLTTPWNFLRSCYICIYKMKWYVNRKIKKWCLSGHTGK